MLQRSIDDVLTASADIEWAVSIRDDEGHELACRNGDRAMTAASVGKLLLLVEVARQCAAGDLSGATLLRRSPELLVADSGLWQHLHAADLAIDDLCVLVASVSDNVIAVLVGLVVATAGFFGAHSTAAGWTGQAAPVGKAQASSLYNLFYYGGSSAVGWLGGVAFDARGWTAVAVTILACAGIAAVLAALFLHDG